MEYRAARTVAFAPGDVLLLYTDGATEAPAPGGDLFGEDRLQAIVKSSGHLPPRGVLERVREALHTWTGGAQNRTT